MSLSHSTWARPLRTSCWSQQCIRHKSSSPYGRSHVLHSRNPILPPPVVGKYPQLVIRADGSSFTHWTTSPRSTITLTRDVTNNPVWNTGLWASSTGADEEAAATGRLGRFSRRFRGMGEGTEQFMQGGNPSEE